MDNKPIYKMTGFYGNGYKGTEWDTERLSSQRCFFEDIAFELRLEKGGCLYMRENVRKL